MRPHRLLALAVIGALSFSPAPALADDCRLSQITSVDMGSDDAGGPTVVMNIAGHPATLLVDTGGTFSMLKEHTVNELALDRGKMERGGYLTMFGGTRINTYAVARDVVMGHMQAKWLQMAIVPDGALNSDLDGTFAPDLMVNYDIDFDFAHAKFNMFSRNHCPGQVVYWTSPADAAKILVDFDPNFGHIQVPVDLDGKRFSAGIDTGSSRTIISLESSGIDPHDPLLKPAEGTSGWLTYPFKSLNFQGVAVKNPNILLVPDAAWHFPFGSIKMIIGMNVLRQLHLYIAYHEHVLYVTPATAH